MKPLQLTGLGFVLLVLETPVHGYDVYADPVGWVFVLLGLRALRRDFPHRGGLLCAGAVALVVSVPLWVPFVLDALDDADDSLAWTANLPRFGTTALLCFAFARAATDATDLRAAAWWRTLYLGTLVVIALPVLIFGGGLHALDDVAGAGVVLVPLGITVLLFVHSGREWAASAAPTGN